MRFDPHILDEIRTRLPVSQVVSRRVKLKRAGREYKGLSPFKSEKTPSFTVNDQKGFYHCFATGEHGDIFRFLMETEGLSFPEAVERLAEEAGVPLPKPEPPTPQAKAQSDLRSRLYELVEASTVYFEDQLQGRAGDFARSYLARRGLSEASIGSFRLGYAPGDRTALKKFLTAKGFSEREMIASGMIIGGEDIREPYDRFRNRVMFPIRDLKGRPIAFGGRALDPDQPAKYLNSNDTPLFHKGQTLYNAHAARQPAHDGQPVVAVEGYMDVIALSQGGFAASVAPLGTALTAEQLTLMWRMADEPVLCFDGDTAGRKAAFRAIDTALPHLKPGNSLRFAFLPEGVDPDDLIRENGAAAFRGVLEKARPLVDVLFEREWGEGDWSTPERRAGLEERLKGIVATIGHEGVRGHYERDVRNRLFQAWRGGRSGGRPGSLSTHNNATDGRQPTRGPVSVSQPALKRPFGRHNGGGASPGASDRFAASGLAPHASESLRRSARAAGHGAAIPAREGLIITCLLNHPFLIDEYAEEIAALPFLSVALRETRDAILSTHAEDKGLDSESLRSHLRRLGSGDLLHRLSQTLANRPDRFAEPDAEADAVREGFEHIMALQQGRTGLARPLGSGLAPR